jgi:hypothetical protein
MSDNRGSTVINVVRFLLRAQVQAEDSDASPVKSGRFITLSVLKIEAEVPS